MQRPHRGPQRAVRAARAVVLACQLITGLVHSWRTLQLLHAMRWRRAAPPPPCTTTASPPLMCPFQQRSRPQGVRAAACTLNAPTLTCPPLPSLQSSFMPPMCTAQLQPALQSCCTRSAAQGGGQRAACASQPVTLALQRGTMGTAARRSWWSARCGGGLRAMPPRHGGVFVRRRQQRHFWGGGERGSGGGGGGTPGVQELHPAQ